MKIEKKGIKTMPEKVAEKVYERRKPTLSFVVYSKRIIKHKHV
jgi:hypothetical protein